MTKRMSFRRMLPFLLTPLATIAAASPARAQSTPLSFVSNLDLECYKTNPGYLGVTVTLRHLNPVLQSLPPETVVVGQRQQLCVPVAKNNVIPPPADLNLIRFVDLSCYGIQGVNANQPLNLAHLNPVLRQMGLPNEQVLMSAPQQLCLPVIKNNVMPPAAVRRLVEHIDLKCYAISATPPLNVPLNLRHLNPVLQNIPPANVTVTQNRQLCVPVAKNNQPIPADVLAMVRWVDLKKYDIVGPALANPIPLQIRHINPLFLTLPAEQVFLTARHQLAVPVAKNGAFPPNAPPFPTTATTSADDVQ